MVVLLFSGRAQSAELERHAEQTTMPPQVVPPELLPIPYLLDLEDAPPTPARAFASAHLGLDLSRRWSRRFSYRERSAAWATERNAYVTAQGALRIRSAGSGNGLARLGPLDVSMQTREANDPFETRTLVKPASEVGFDLADLASPSAETWFNLMGPVPLAPRAAGVAAVTVPVEMRVGNIDDENVVVRGDRTIKLTGAARIGGRRCARIEYEDVAASDLSDTRVAASMRGRGIAYIDPERGQLCALRYANYVSVAFAEMVDASAELSWLVAYDPV